MSGSVFEVSAAGDLPVASLLEAVQAHGYAAVRGLFSKAEMRGVVEGFKAGFDASKDRPGQGDSPKDVMRNFQKVIIGVGAQAHYPIPRCLRILYNPLWDEDVYGAHEMFRKLARLRNHIQGHAPDYAVDSVQDKLWTAARLQQYPPGCGFFAPHCDVLSAKATADVGMLKFIQIILLITERGVDYDKGGTYVEKDGERIDIEAVCGAGDVIVYDGRSVHGVWDIDPHKLPDLSGPSGRLVALVTLYADMT